MDSQRSNKADRNLGHAGEVLDIALQAVRVEGIVTDVFQLLARVLLDKILASLDGRRAVIIGRVARYLHAMFLFLGDRAVHLEGERAKGLCVELDLDLVLAQRQRRNSADDIQCASQRKFHLLRCKLFGSQHDVIVQPDRSPM